MYDFAFKRPLAAALLSSLALAGCVQTTTSGDDNPAAVNPTNGVVVPGSFPAVDAARLESMVSSIQCTHTTSRGARSIGETDGYRGYAIRLCNPDREPEGAAVAWVARRGQAEIIVATAAGWPFPRRPGGNVNHADRDNQLAIFGVRMAAGSVACVAARNNRSTAPFGLAFCYERDN